MCSAFVSRMYVLIVLLLLSCVSFLSDFSTSLITRSSDNETNISSCFPHFIWLIRDAALQPTDKDDNPITPTEFLKTQVLVPSPSVKQTDQDRVIDAINTLFPSIECHTLPRPSVDKIILSSIAANEDQLELEFSSELQTFRDHVLGKIQVKLFSNQQCTCGLVMAELLTCYVSLVNSDSKIALEDAYVIAVEGILLKRAEVLTDEYRCEMERLLKGRYPMEEYVLNERDQQHETTLMTIHERVMKSKMTQFERELDSFFPADSTYTASIKESLMSGFVDDIYRIEGGGGVVRIVGGKLYHFALKNFSESKQFCEDLSMKVFRDITDRIEKATIKRIPVELSDKLLHAERQYYSEAVGPAKDEVYAKRREELTKKCNDLSSIPGRPNGLFISGTDKNRIKLQWAGAENSNSSIAYYEVQYMSNTTDWTTLPDKYQQQCAIIPDLENSSDYIFRVRAMSKTRGPGNWSDAISTKTTVGTLQQRAATVGTFVGGTLASPLLGFAAMPFCGPVSAVVGLVAAPVVGAVLANKVSKHYGPTGDFLKKNLHSDLTELPDNVANIQVADESEGE